MKTITAACYVAAILTSAPWVAADPQPTTPYAVSRNALVAHAIAQGTDAVVGIMTSDKTCWVAARLLTQAYDDQVFYCIPSAEVLKQSAKPVHL